jgi:hypothetical protein
MSYAAEVVATFLIVSYVASAATEGLSSLFRVRAWALLRSIRRLLDETHNSAPVTLAIYNNYLFNPQQAGRAESIAALGSRPSTTDKLTFARALMDEIGLSGNDPNQIITNIRGSRLGSALQSLAINLVERHLELIRSDNPTAMTAMHLEIANWFERSTYRLDEDYRRWTQLSNFVIGGGLAAVLGLNPLPADLTAHAPPGWWLQGIGALTVAISTLFGAPFWFALLNKLVPIKPRVPDEKVGATPPSVAAAPPGGAGGAPPPSPPSPPAPRGSPAPPSGPAPAPAPTPAEPPGAASTPSSGAGAPAPTPARGSS